MSTRMAITLLLTGVIASVLFGIGTVLVLTVPALSENASYLLPATVISSVLIAPLAAWQIAPRLRSSRSRQIADNRPHMQAPN